MDWKEGRFWLTVIRPFSGTTFLYCPIISQRGQGEGLKGLWRVSENCNSPKVGMA